MKWLRTERYRKGKEMLSGAKAKGGHDKKRNAEQWLGSDTRGAESKRKGTENNIQTEGRTNMEEQVLMELFKTTLKWFLGKYGKKAENGETYCEIDGIRLVFDGAELLGWYNPGTEE